MSNKLDPALLAAIHKLNGFETESGIRILGLGSTAADYSIEEFNDPDCWRFAWTKFLPRQAVAFAYDIAGSVYWHPDAGRQVSRLNFDGASELTASSVDEFLKLVETHIHESVRSLLDIHQRPPKKSVLAPLKPPVIAGRFLPIDVVKMPAHLALIAGGDLATSVFDGVTGVSRQATGIEPFFDERGRQRLRIRWRD